MKFKFLLLSMLGAAAVISCNNESVIDGDKPGGGTVKEGVPVYASFDFRLSSDPGLRSNPTTYAGEEEVTSTLEEAQVANAAMFVYKFDGASTSPEFAIYVSGLSTAASGTGTKITMKATSGQKKIFLACNAGRVTGTPTSMLNGVTALETSSTVWGTSYTDLNKTLDAASGGGWAVNTPASGGFGTKAEGLIKALARDALYGAATPTYSGTNFMLMTNWDGPNDVSTGSADFYSTCLFTLTADVDSLTSAGGTPTNTPSAGEVLNATNSFNINVQRAFAKVTLKMGVTATTQVSPGPGFTANGYKGAVGEDQEGEFHPWTGSGTTAMWSLGNIPKATLPFQQYVGSSVRDMYYLSTDDSATVSSNYTNWTNHYDNSRVFPLSMGSYPLIGLTVTQVKDVMVAAGNNTGLDGYAYTTESARQHPVLQSQTPYVIIGGRYHPKRVLTAVSRANVSTAPPTLTYSDNYSWSPVGTDTLYYVASDKVFIAGKNLLLRYYAWQKGFEPNANQTGLDTDFGTPTILAINNAKDSGDLLAYYEAQCWYRVTVQDPGATPENRVMVRRNHIYDVNISKINGPGIADPNDILTDKPVLELDTYVTASIYVLPWHRVKQNVEVDQK
ncbi:MAG: fimbria major subunit [Tannerella sp.]|jgi:hypothetical protein|nr:fimbria major subunit [Tannerella sp.]